MRVVKRAFQILDVLSERETMSLSEISDRLAVPPNSAWNLLSVLSELGYVKKVARGQYALGDEKPCSRPDYKSVIRPPMEELCRDIKESVVAVALRGSSLDVIQSMDYMGSVYVSNKIYYEEGTLYKWASGKIVLAWQPERVVRHVVERLGMPKGPEWKGVGSQAALMSRLARFRAEKAAERVTPLRGGGEIFSFAVPVFDGDGNFKMALGANCHSSLASKTHRRIILSHLRLTAEKISRLL